MAVGLPPEDLAPEEETLTRAESAGSPGDCSSILMQLCLFSASPLPSKPSDITSVAPLPYDL